MTLGVAWSSCRATRMPLPSSKLVTGRPIGVRAAAGAGAGAAAAGATASASSGAIQTRMRAREASMLVLVRHARLDRFTAHPREVGPAGGAVPDPVDADGRLDHRRPGRLVDRAGVDAVDLAGPDAAGGGRAGRAGRQPAP